MKTENRVRHDLGPVQAYMLDAVVAALNSQQDSPAWERDLDRFRRHSGTRWINLDALLFDYTLARLIAICPGALPPIGASITSANDVFIRAFTDAAVEKDVALATYLWADINFGWKEHPGAHLPSMTALLTRLRACWRRATLGQIRDRLPPELEELA